MQESTNSLGGQTVNAPEKSLLVIEQFLSERYSFRRNVLNGKAEFAVKKSEDETPASDSFRPLTQQALNSITLSALREGLDEMCNPKSDIPIYVNSEDVPEFNPVTEFMNRLPRWDGQNHVAQLFSRLPGISTEQHSFLAVWLRSMVAHWLQMDALHGNEVVPVLIGAQGCGKTTFLRRLLPKELREYYLDHINLSNKFDKEMALTNNLLVNIDEFDTITARQQPKLKQALSNNKVNGRPIFGKVQQDRMRFASFAATTNNPHPLTDVTGSRRFLCMNIPKGQLIDNTGDIDYGQLYAQVLYELKETNAPYWFNNEEVARIQELNLRYMQQKDMAEIISACFRKPQEGEAYKAMSSTDLLHMIRNEYPLVADTHSSKVHIGLAMKDFGYEFTIRSNVPFYKVVPLLAA